MAGRIVVDDARMDVAAAKINSVQAGLQGLQGRMNGSLSAGAPPAVKGQVDAAVAQARATVAGVAGRCSARSTELRRRAILARIASGDIRSIDLQQLIAWNAERQFINARVGNGKVDDGGILGAFKGFADDVGDAASDAAGYVGRNALGATQLTLDGLGLIPVLGEPADGVNGLIYAARGDNVNAGLSFAGMIPIAGWGATGGKLGRKVLHAADAGGGGAHTVGKAAREAAERRERIRIARETLISPERAHHILRGERRVNARTGKVRWSGGHAHPGQPGKSPFPKNWSDDHILDTVADMASRRGRLKLVDSDLVNDSANLVYEERREGLLVHVVLDPDGKVVTAYPVDVVRAKK